MIDKNHVSASFGDRTPPYANFHYTCTEFVTESGTTRTARSSSRLRTHEQWATYSAERIGKVIGFGMWEGETILGFRLITAEYKADPQGRSVRINDEANKMLIRVLSDQRNTAAGFTKEEWASRDWLKKHAGRLFLLAEGTPQMTTDQFFNTMPEEEAPGGYFLPRGLCELVNGQT